MVILQELALEGEPVLTIGGADLCALLGISPAALTDLCRRGLAHRMGHNSYNLQRTIGDYTAHLRSVAARWGEGEEANDLTAQRARLAKEQADGQALKNAALRGELVPAADVERAWGDVLRQVRARVLAVPSRLRQALALAPADVDKIDRELREALTELGNADD